MREFWEEFLLPVGIVLAILFVVCWLVSLFIKSQPTIELKKIHWTCTKERGNDEMISAVSVGNGVVVPIYGESSECVQWTKN